MPCGLRVRRGARRGAWREACLRAARQARHHADGAQASPTESHAAALGRDGAVTPQKAESEGPKARRRPDATRREVAAQLILPR